MTRVLFEEEHSFYAHGREHAAAIKSICFDIERETNLSPRNPKTNQLLSSLVSYLSHIENCGYCSYIPFDTLTEEAKKLPRICGEAECMMEKFWATYFISKKSLTQESLKEFWYYSNYKALWDLEAELIKTAAVDKTLVFLGSGAMPFTAFFAAWSGYKVICVDFDKEACALSKEFIQKLGLAGRIEVIRHDATTFDFSEEHFVICASLIEGKESLYDTLFERGIQHFAVRDAEGAYKFLYAPSPRPNACAFTEVAQTVPNDQCINTLRLFRHTTYTN